MAAPQTASTPALTPEQAQKQAQILQDGSGFEAYQFASEVAGADILALQARVLAVGDSWDLFHYARDVRGADWASLQAQLLRGNSIRFIACFAREIPGADLATCQARVLEAGDSIDVLQFAQIPGVDVGQLQARMLKVGSPLHAYRMRGGAPSIAAGCEAAQRRSRPHWVEGDSAPAAGWLQSVLRPILLLDVLLNHRQRRTAARQHAVTA